MNQKQRTKEIVKYLEKHGELTVEEACNLFEASPATVRRDFTLLVSNNNAAKLWGGIARIDDIPREENGMSPASYRQTLNASEKKAIAECAASYVQDGDIIIIDGGTTTYFMTQFLASKKIQVITNSILIAHQIDLERKGSFGAEVFVTGGLIYPEAGILVGPQSIANIRQYHANWAFLSVGGILPDKATNSNQLIVETERAIIDQSEKIVMLADHSKFGKRSMCTMCHTEEIDILITNHFALNSAIISEIKEKNVKVVEIN